MKEKSDFSNKSDEKIAELVQKGQIQAFGILINRYEKKLTRYARKFLFKNTTDLDDILQNIFIKAYKNIKSFDLKRKFSPWIYRIAHNELINHIKQKKPFFFPCFDLDVFWPHIIQENDFNDKIDRQIMRKNINKALKQLKPKYREIILLYYFEEFKYQEISDILKIPISTVGIRLKRAKKLIKLIYHEEK
tara:strand:+ start:1559 stop:2131 length:573 start_codon:yes stop_codon:yes gene_type:complete